MAILVSAHQLSHSFGARPLFQGLSFAIETGERIGLIGPNGAGKSTLLKIIAGRIAADEGTLSLQRGLRVGFLEQVPSFQPQATVQSTVMEGSYDPHEWEEIARAQTLLSKLSLSEGEVHPDQEVALLSGGWKKRVALARELMKQPDLLLLDEPTNHLDVESILWLEEFLAESPFATVTITHDRAFLQKISNRIIEVDRRNPGGLLSIKGTYADYLYSKQDLLSAQEKQEERLKNTLRRETEWLRRGAKARTTKQQARIQRAEELGQSVEELQYRNATASVRLDFQGTEKNPKKLIEAKGISKRYGDKVVVPPTDLLITPKSRIGLLGPNGCGKSTLIRMLLAKEPSDTGSVFHSEHLKPLYFEQNRESLDPEISILKTVCPRGDHVDYAGQRVHVRSYLDRFLFSASQVEQPVGWLSGGEQSRLLLAKLMLHEANVLVLDEPTNDLDMATLDILQDVLQEFPGAVLLVSHDRYFMDQVANQILAFGEENGKKKIIPFANVIQWQDWHETQSEKEKTKPKEKVDTGTPSTPSLPANKKKKLSFKEQRELDTMESNIQAKEQRLAELEAESTSASVATSASKLLEITNEMSKLQAEIDRLYARWQELES